MGRMNPLSDPRVRSYLDAVCREVRLKRVEPLIRQELTSHIQDFVDAKISEGMPVEEATELALLRLGDATKLGKRFFDSHRPFYLRKSFSASVFLLLATSATILFLTRFTTSSLTKTEDAINPKAWIQSFLKDQRLLATESFFAPSTAKRDAGAFLNERIEWDSQGSWTQTPFPKWPDLRPSGELRAKLDVWKDEWLEHIQEPGIRNLDFSWMKELGKYDHWDLFATGPLSKGKRLSSDLNLLSVPLPNMQSLMGLAKLRLLKGLASKDILPALQEVRHFIHLIHTQELPVSSMVAIALLRKERQAFEKAVSMGLLSRAAWTPISEEVIFAAKRGIYSFIGIFSLFTPSETLEEIFLKNTSRVGICSAIAEGIYHTALIRPFFREHFPFEKDFRDRLNLLERIVAYRPGECRISYFREIWKDGRGYYKEVMLKGQIAWKWRLRYTYAPLIPFVRQAVGAELAEILSSNSGYNLYLRSPASPQASR